MTMSVGSIIQFVGNTVPEKYIICDGRAVSRTEYSELYSVIGNTYGIGDGVSTFNVPNLCGKVAIGSSLSHLIGDTGGEKFHTLISGEVAEHLHVVPEHGHSSTIAAKTPQLTHTITQPKFSYNKLTGSKVTSRTGQRVVYNSVKSAAMTRSANLAISDHPATDCTMSGGVTDCPAMTSGYAGNGDAHNNMMPYIALVFLIQAREA